MNGDHAVSAAQLLLEASVVVVLGVHVGVQFPVLRSGFRRPDFGVHGHVVVNKDLSLVLVVEHESNSHDERTGFLTLFVLHGLAHVVSGSEVTSTVRVKNDFIASAVLFTEFVFRIPDCV